MKVLHLNEEKVTQIAAGLKVYIQGLKVGLNLRQKKWYLLYIFLGGYTFGVISSLFIIVLWGWKNE